MSIAKNNYKHQHRSLGTVYVYSIHMAVAAGPTLKERALQYNKDIPNYAETSGLQFNFFNLSEGILKRL